MKIYRIFRTLARLSLLLIVFGFFQPVACGFSGPEIADLAFSDGSFSLILPTILLIAASLVSLIPIFRLRKKSTMDLFIIPLVIIVLLLASLFSAKNSFGDLMDFISYDRGSTFIASAIVLSLLFASLFYILSAKERREEKNMILIRETNESLLSSYERCGYVAEEPKYEEFSLPQNDGSPAWQSKPFIIPQGIRKIACALTIDKNEDKDGTFLCSVVINGRKIRTSYNEDAFIMAAPEVKEGDDVSFEVELNSLPDSSYLKARAEIIILKKS